MSLISFGELAEQMTRDDYATREDAWWVERPAPWGLSRYPVVERIRESVISRPCDTDNAQCWSEEIFSQLWLTAP